MITITKPEEILQKLEEMTTKYLECIYIKTKPFDIYLNDATKLEIYTDKGYEEITFNTKVNVQKFSLDSIEQIVHSNEMFDIFTDYYDEDDEYDYYRIDFKDSEVKIYFNNEL